MRSTSSFGRRGLLRDMSEPNPTINAIASKSHPSWTPNFHKHHCLFSPPFSKASSAGGILAVTGVGVGLIVFAVEYQQRKSGFIK